LIKDQRVAEAQPGIEAGKGALAPIETCNGQSLKHLLQVGLAWLERHQQAINALNVYPVPDGDTGTNMLLTMQSACQEIQNSPLQEVGVIAQMAAHGALMGARGNSGVILSQILRGFARGLEGLAAFDSLQLASALREGANTAYKGVIKPVEGTILTVARESADAAARAATASRDLRYVLDQIVREARASVSRTPTLLKVLAEAGVVDAGGQGLLTLLEGMLRHLQGEQIEIDHALVAAVDLHALHPDNEEGYGDDVQFIIHGEGLNVEEIRDRISAMGESALIVGDSRAIKVHVHAPDPGPAISYGASVGSLSRVIVENMQEQYQGFIMSKSQAPAAPEQPLSGIGTVTVTPGPGLSKVFESLGASAIVSGGQTMNPSTEDLLQAVERIPADEVIILPNNKNIVMAAEQAKLLSEKKVEVVRTASVPQGIAALLALNYQADLETNARLMAEAIESVGTAEVTTAIRSAQIDGIQVREGETIGLINGKLEVKGASPEEVILAALARMNADECEIVTLYYGEAVDEDTAQELAAAIANAYPHQEVEVVDGGQPHYPYILSVE